MCGTWYFNFSCAYFALGRIVVSVSFPVYNQCLVFVSLGWTDRPPCALTHHTPDRQKTTPDYTPPPRPGPTHFPTATAGSSSHYTSSSMSSANKLAANKKCYRKPRRRWRPCSLGGRAPASGMATEENGTKNAGENEDKNRDPWAFDEPGQDDAPAEERGGRKKEKEDPAAPASTAMAKATATAKAKAKPKPKTKAKVKKMKKKMAATAKSTKKTNLHKKPAPIKRKRKAAADPSIQAEEQTLIALLSRRSNKWHAATHFAYIEDMKQAARKKRSRAQQKARSSEAWCED